MRNLVLIGVLGLAACSPSTDDGDGEASASLTIGDSEVSAASEVPEKMFLECEIPMMFGDQEGSRNFTFIEFGGEVLGYNGFDNEARADCSPAGEGCQTSISDGELFIERRGFNRDDPMVRFRVNLDTLETSYFEVIDGEEVPSDKELTCTNGEYPAGVTDEFGFAG